MFGNWVPWLGDVVESVTVRVVIVSGKEIIYFASPPRNNI